MKVKKLKTLDEAKSILANSGVLYCEANSAPTISTIADFLAICKERGITPTKSRISKCGKIISARIADKDERIRSREGMETAKAGDLIVSDGDNTYYAVAAENIAKFYELDSNGNSITGDSTKWKKIGRVLDYYITPFDVNVKVEWQAQPLEARAGYSLVLNDKNGTDISPVAPEIFKDATLWKKI